MPNQQKPLLNKSKILSNLRKKRLEDCKIIERFENEEPLSITDCYVDVMIVKNWKPSQQNLTSHLDNNNYNSYQKRRHHNSHLSSDCISIKDIFKESRKVLVIGAAGTGKTTWCKMLSYMWANNNNNNNNNNHQNSEDGSGINNNPSQKYLQESFDYCFLFHLRDVSQSKWEREFCFHCSIPICDETTMVNFLVNNSERILFILGIM